VGRAVRSHRPITMTFVFVSVAFCGMASAADLSQPVDDKRPNDALAACASGNVDKGIAILGELYAETRNPSYVFNQGRCYQKNGQLEPARHRFAEYLRIGTNEPPEDIQRAQGFVKEIDDTLARQRASQAAPVIVAPAAPPADGHAHALRMTSFALAAFGAVAVGVGVYMSLQVRATNDRINQEFAGKEWVTDGVWLQQQLSDGARYETWQWVGYGVGVAALAGAVTTYLLSGSRLPWGGSSERTALNVTPAVSPDGVGGVLRLRF
jgi:hypothetical protein